MHTLTCTMHILMHTLLLHQRIISSCWLLLAIEGSTRANTCAEFNARQGPVTHNLDDLSLVAETIMILLR